MATPPGTPAWNTPALVTATTWMLVGAATTFAAVGSVVSLLTGILGVGADTGFRYFGGPPISILLVAGLFVGLGVLAFMHGVRQIPAALGRDG